MVRTCLDYVILVRQITQCVDSCQKLHTKLFSCEAPEKIVISHK